MTPSIDVEITSETTARAILASAEVDPVDLQATETETLEAVVHRFLHSVAKGQNVELEVVYRRGENSRHLTVLSNGKVEPRTPSTPIPPTAAPTAPPADTGGGLLRTTDGARGRGCRTPHIRNPV